MVQPKKTQGDIGNGSNKRESNTMPYPKKDLGDARSPGPNSGKPDSRGQNGNRSGFRTDTAISNSRLGNERTLQPWVPDASDGMDGSLEKTSSGGTWDQFAENERLFGLTTDYDENIYTTTIDKSHPQYRERIAAAERKAREIERSLPTTAHVAEERVMDHAGGDDRGGDEEDKYSGVRRQDFPPLSNRENKYIPPSKRAPSGLATVTGAPVDPAIISSQLRVPPSKKQSVTKADDGKALSQGPAKVAVPETPDSQKAAEAKSGSKSAPKQEANNEVESKSSGTKSPSPKPTDPKNSEKSAAPLRPSGTTSRTISPQAKAPAPSAAPSAASTVERDVLNSFKTFASQQRQNAEKVRSSKAKADKEVKLTELKKFADSFKLSTPVPTDLISIIAKDPSKQKEIQAKAIQNAEDVARAKADAAVKDKDGAAKESQPKPSIESSVGSATTDARTTARSAAPPHAASPSGSAARHQGGRQSYANPPYNAQSYRNDRSSGQHAPPQNRQPLAQRLRSVEQQKMSQPPQNHQHTAGVQDMRLPPTGPANTVDPSFARRLSGVPSHMGGKLNPNSHEFRPNPFATSFNPNSHASAGSSPRSAANNVSDGQTNPSPSGQLIRRKTKAIDVKKCFILSHIKSLPTQGRNWDDNDGIRQSFDTPPTWRQLQEGNEKPESSMHLTYKEFLERQSFPAQAMATPNPPHVMPQLAHQHQLPFHLQHGAHNMAPRQSPHMPPMQMHTPHGPVPHVPFNNVDDHRMMHSNSAQSFASPRMAQVPITYAPAVNSPAQVPYNQPVMQPFVGPGTPQMGQFRSFSNNPQFMPQQAGHMGGHMMVQPQFIASPQGLVPAPQMQMYAGVHPQFIPQNTGPPQSMPGSNGYPSPGRPSAPMMVHQGSQQGQPVYGMSPNIQYQQPVFVPQQPGGQVGNIRGYSSPGPQHFGTSPQQMHQYGAQHRSGSNSYAPKNFGGVHGQHQVAQQVHPVPTGTQGRTPEGSDEAK